MDVEVFGPCLLVDDVPASADFYVEHFGFQPRVELDWFTTLSHQDRPYELAFVRADHDTVPEGWRAAAPRDSSSGSWCLTRRRSTPGCARSASAWCCRCGMSHSARAT